MGRHYQILWPLFSLFLVRVDLTDLWPLQIPVKLVKVYDGDTVLVRYGTTDVKVRLLKLDAPEKGQLFFKGEGDAGQVAKRCFSKLIEKETRLVLKPYATDIYGRMLGEINDLSLRAIQNGCATLYPHSTFDSLEEKYLFLKSLREAKRLRKGIWNFSGFKQPKIWRKTNKRSARRR